MGRACRLAAQAGVAGDRPDSEGSKAPRLARRRPYLGNQPPFGPKPGDLGARQDAHGPFLSRVRSGRNHITARPRALPAAPPEARVTERPCRANRADSARRGGTGRRVPGATPRRLRSALVRGNRIRPTGSIRLLRDERPEEPGYRDAAMLPGARRRSPGKRRTRMPDAADTPGRGRRRPTSIRASPWKSSTSRRAACPCCATSTCRASARGRGRGPAGRSEPDGPAADVRAPARPAGTWGCSRRAATTKETSLESRSSRGPDRGRNAGRSPRAIGPPRTARRPRGAEGATMPRTGRPA